MKVDVKIKRNLVPKITAETQKAVRSAVKVVAQDLARTASETAPHLTGDLEDSYTISYSGTNGVHAQATIEFAVYHGSFNYAVAMHEWMYNLGEGSQAKSGGTGMSGATYSVGRKYLIRVLQGEAFTYADYIGYKFREAIGGVR